MLRLSLPTYELWNPEKEIFETVGNVVVDLEHSLYTISGWEMKWKVPFAGQKGLTHEQLFDYIINFMCQTPDIPTKTWLSVDQKTIKEISDYMEDPMTATTISRHYAGKKVGGRHETVTSELIYFYMAQFGIPFECEHWHLNRLMMLINVCAVKNSPTKKMGKGEAAALQRRLNAERRAKTGSRG